MSLLLFFAGAGRRTAGGGTTRGGGFGGGFGWNGTQSWSGGNIKPLREHGKLEAEQDVAQLRKVLEELVYDVRPPEPIPLPGEVVIPPIDPRLVALASQLAAIDQARAMQAILFAQDEEDVEMLLLGSL